MNKEVLVKTDQYGYYYPRIPYNHDAEVKVERDGTQGASEQSNYIQGQVKSVEPVNVRIL